MSSLDEPDDAGGGDHGEDTAVENLSRPALEARVRELEREKAALKLDIEAMNVHVKRDRQLLDALAVQGIPVDQRAMKELHANSKSLRDLLVELEQREPGQ